MKYFLPAFVFIFLIFPQTIFARVTPGDIHAEKREVFEQSLSKISDPQKRQTMKTVDELLYQTNQDVCDRFDEEVVKMSATLQEFRRRLDVEDKPTVVAFGSGRNQIEDAEYWVNWAAEAVAYQRIQDYTPQFSSDANLKSSAKNSAANLKSNLNGLASKIIKAKGEVSQALKLESVTIPDEAPEGPGGG